MFTRGWRVGLRLVAGFCVLWLGGCPNASNCDEQPNAAWCRTGASVELSIDSDMVRVTPSGTAEVTITLERTGDWTNRGPIAVEAHDLPSDIGMDTLTVPSSQSEVVAVFHADAGIDEGVFHCQLIAKAAEEDVVASEKALDIVVPGAFGQPDRSFDFDGQIIYTRPDERYELVRSIVDSKGRFLLLLSETTSKLTRMLRVLPDGKLDAEMSEKFESLKENQNLVTHHDMKSVLEDRIVIGAQLLDDADEPHNSILMLTEDGDLDPAFGDGGKVKVEPIEESFGFIPRRNDLLLKRSGSYASYLYSGAVNTAFFETGFGYLSNYYSRAVVREDDSLLALTTVNPPDARIITNTETTFLSGNYQDIESRLEDMVSSFVDGKLGTCIADSSYRANCTGSYRTRVNDENSIIYHALTFRLDAEANFDPTFGDDGFILTRSGTGEYHGAHGILALPDGNLLVGYEVHFNGVPQEYFIACYQPDGSRCQGFGDNGEVSTAMPPHQMHLDKYSRLLVHGTVAINDNETHLIITRLWL